MRIEGTHCSLFWRAFDPDSRDFAVYDHVQSLGFASVDWEDIGARGTIFDDYDTPDHFSRIESLRRFLTGALAGGADDADELLLVLEDLSPRLAATLGTAARSLLAATSEEDCAHVGLSARRYCEQLADALYPPSPNPVNGRDVSRDRVRNRLWAYVEQELGRQGAVDAIRLQQLGDLIDDVIERANAVLHATPTNDHARSLLADLTIVSANLLALAPRSNRKPYYAYAPRVAELVREWFAPRAE
jgi:hypothetical protein